MKSTILLFFKEAFCKRNVGLLLGWIFINLQVNAQTVSQVRFPEFVGDTYNNGGYWAYPERAQSDDNTYAYSAVYPGTSDFLHAYGFHFSIPSGATIRGIKVTIGRFGDNGSQIRDEFVKLKKNDVFVGDNKAATATYWPITETLIEYGGENDLWGTTWTAADINNNNFGMSLVVTQPNTILWANANVDYIKIAVYYVPLDPSYCAGAAVALIESGGATNPSYALNTPDGQVAKILDMYGDILLDLTGEVTPRPQGGHIKVRWRDGDPNDGGNPLAYYICATNYSTSTGYNWSSPVYYPVSSPTLVDQEITVGENTRYVMFRVSSGGNKALEIDAVTYDCPCSGATITSVTANPTAICWGSTTTLSVTGDLCGADHWAWYQYSCGGTPVGTGSSITITPYPGTYNYYVRAEGGSLTVPGTCSSTTVTINEWPTASITGGEQNACVSTTLTATTNVTNPGYNWYKGDVLIEGATNSTLVVSEPGNYKVKITNTATGCERTSYAFPVNSVSTLPSNKTVFADPSTVCPGTRVNIGIRNSESGVYYRLRNDKDDSFIGDIVSGINGVNIYLLAGNITETSTFNVIAIKGYCVLEMADKPTVTVLSNEPAITEVKADPAAICQGNSSTLSVTGDLGSATAWKWYSGSCGGTLVGTGASIAVSPTEATTYYVRGEGGCATAGAACSEVSVSVNPYVTPTVTISSSDSDNKICFPTHVIFTATPGETGGGTVSYKWVLNGTVIDVWDQSTMGTDELEDGDQVSCQMTITGGTCLSQTTVTSNIITMEVDAPSLLLSVAVTSSEADNEICYGTEVIFTATPANTGGGLVSYKWKHNDDLIDHNSNTFPYNELDNGDRVSCEITVSYPACSTSATATSNEIVNSVISLPTPWASIQSSDPDNSICSGTNVTFTVTAENTEGNTVYYQWVKNGTTVGLNQTTYVTSDLKDQDEVFCYFAVTGCPCDQSAAAISNSINMNVTSPIMPAVSIVSSDTDNTVCLGTSVTFTASAENTDGGTVYYQWYLNGVNVGTNQNTYTNSSLANKDQVSCQITITGDACLTTNMANSDILVVTVNQCCTPGQMDMYEPNNSLAAAADITVDSPEISGNILNSKDQDWFKFTASADGYYTILFNANGGKEVVELSNAKGQKLRSGSKTEMIFNLVANTTYYIKIYDSKLKTGSPCYSLSIAYQAVIAAGSYMEQNMDIKVASMEPASAEIIRIWPNPTKKDFELYNGNEVQVKIQVMDANGRIIETFKKVAPSETVVFGAKYAPGMYFVQSFGNGIQQTFKLVKQ